MGKFFISPIWYKNLKKKRN